MLEAHTALVPYLGDGLERARAWATLPDDERRRRAVAACRDHDAATLCALADAWLTLYGRAGAVASQHTRANYRRGIMALLAAWSQENLLRPRRDAGALWLRSMEDTGLAPSTIKVRVAAARALYAALRWAGATEADPLRDARPARDPVPAWEKRQPYIEDEVAALLEHAVGDDRVLILLGAHAGLRVSEMVALQWRDVNLGRHELRVRRGKGGRPRTVAMSRSLSAELRALALLPAPGATPAAPATDAAGAEAREATGGKDRNADGGEAREPANGNAGGAVGSPHVLPYRTRVTAWRRLAAVCARAGVDPKGLHSLRHAAGTRVVRETHSLEEAARHLGHASIETTRAYAKWSDARLKETVGAW